MRTRSGGFAASRVKAWPLLTALLAASCAPTPRADAGDVVSVPWITGNAASFQTGSPAERGARAAEGALPVKLYRPEGPGPFPYVVLLHGCGGLHQDAMRAKWVEPWAALLRAHGIGAAVVDSFAPRGVDQVCTRDVAAWAVRRADDAYSVAAWLARQPDADAGRLALMGMSNGGRTVLAALRLPAREPPLFVAGIALYPGCQSDRESRFHAPLLVLIGRGDTVTPARECEDMQRLQPATAPELRLIVYPRAPHTFDMPLPDRTVLGMRLGHDAEATADAQRQVLRFLAENGLRAAAPTR
jgi:dienelactone hydrolase